MRDHHKILAIANILCLSAVTNIVVGQVIKPAPKLVVIITIDQLRSDYLETFAPLYQEGGFKRFLNQGTVYTNATYSFSPTDRSSAIANIFTGTTPFYNSITGNKWLNKETLRIRQSSDDDNFNGVYTTSNTSPNNLATSTFCDELKVATEGKAIVYAIANERDVAAFSAGHAADGALWIDEYNGRWCTSDYWSSAQSSWLNAFNSLYAPCNTTEGLVWQPSEQLNKNIIFLPKSDFQKSFSHTFTGNSRYREFKTSALVNENITDMAIYCAKSNSIGVDPITDCLCITYYAGRFNNCTAGECYMEIQDTYVRLDAQISRLIDTFEENAGQNNVLFLLTSTGYVDEEDLNYTQYNIPSGIFYINRTANLLNIYFGALWGQGEYIDACLGQQLYLNRKTLEQKKVTYSQITEQAQEFLAQISGISNVYTAPQLLIGGSGQIEKVRNSYHPERSGDIIIEVTPGWKLINENTNEEQVCRASYIQFPIIFYGYDTPAQKIDTPTDVSCIAPTLSKAIRIRAPNACKESPLF